MNKILNALIFLLLTTTILAQNEPTLFTVEGTPIMVSEFTYIYEKSNGKNADYSEASIKEYLELYKNFKLKVRRARDLKIDTIQSLQKELSGYYKQLSDSYLLDKEITTPLSEEIYNRKEQDVDLSHILINIGKYATTADTLLAFKKINAIKDILDKKTKTFEESANSMSEDENTKKKGGRLGYMTAQFPSGYYHLENAAYNNNVGDVVGPIRTKLGYHLVKINNKRKARGTIEVSHILVKASTEVDMKIKEANINEIYTRLKNGDDFDKVALASSDDKATNKKGGYVGFFGIGRYNLAFEDAAFSLKNDGDISEPIKTTVGWHIIKRISKKEKPQFNNFSKSIEKNLKKSDRFKLKYANLIKSTMKEFEVIEDRKYFQKFITGLNKDFFSYKYKTPITNKETILLSFNNGYKRSLGDFFSYLTKNSRKRMLMNKQGSAQTIASILYDDYVADECMQQQEKNLAQKYPKFKALMREYEEGIYLFEVTKMEVWDKAMNDSLGLSTFYAQSPIKYHWKDRVEATVYNVTAKGKPLFKKIRKYAKKHSAKEVLEKFNKEGEMLSFVTKTYEKGSNKDIDEIKWKKGELSHNLKTGEITQFIKIEKVSEAREKELSEARGFIIADYQDELEKKWLKELSSTYKVDINNTVLKSLIK